MTNIFSITGEMLAVMHLYMQQIADSMAPGNPSTSLDQLNPSTGTNLTNLFVYLRVDLELICFNFFIKKTLLTFSCFSVWAFTKNVYLQKKSWNSAHSFSFSQKCFYEKIYGESLFLSLNKKGPYNGLIIGLPQTYYQNLWWFWQLRNSGAFSYDPLSLDVHVRGSITFNHGYVESSWGPLRW